MDFLVFFRTSRIIMPGYPFEVQRIYAPVAGPLSAGKRQTVQMMTVD